MKKRTLIFAALLMAQATHAVDKPMLGYKWDCTVTTNKGTYSVEGWGVMAYEARSYARAVMQEAGHRVKDVECRS